MMKFNRTTLYNTIRLVFTLILLLNQVHASNGRSFFLNWRAFQESERGRTNSALASMAHVGCYWDHVSVSFSRLAMESLGIGPNQLTLLDPSCVTAVNTSHYIISTTLGSCQSKVVNTSNVVTVSNSIVISPPNIPDLPQITEASTIPSRSNSSPIVINFTCRYDTYQSSGSDEIKKLKSRPATAVSADQLKIDLYTTDKFDQKLLTQSQEIIKGTSIYVKVSLADRALRRQGNIFLDSCYLVELSHQKLSPPHYLIQNGCAVDRDVQYKHDRPPFTADRRFIFRAQRPFRNSPMRLICSVLPCPANECTSQSEYCSDTVSRANTDTSSKGLIEVLYPDYFSVKRRKKSGKGLKSSHSETPVRKLEASTTIASTWRSPATARQACPPSAVYVPCDCPSPSVNQAQQSTASTSPASSVSVTVTIGIAISMFCAGAALVACLWVVYTCTDPRRKMKPVNMSDDGSSSSQDSTTHEKLVGMDQANSNSSVQS